MRKPNYVKIAICYFKTVTIYILMLYVVGFTLAMLVGCAQSLEYEMPNGVRCKIKKDPPSYRIGNPVIYTQLEFLDCNDSNRYVNPEYYREVKR